MEDTSQKSSAIHRALLFDRLERFVNMGDEREAIAAFLRDAPDFFPHIRPSASEPDTEPEVLPEALLPVRDDLRDVWRRGDPNGERLSGLLGLMTGMPWHDSGVDADTMNKFVLYHIARLSGSPVVPNWQTGGFDYAPRRQFHEAVYALMRESWRAKVCAHCKRYFVADKSRQQYCSVDCSVAAQREVQLEYYHRRGRMRRKERSAKRRRKRGK